jgi:uncharacterized protein YdhG (YjbR/CyaY superfamily)
METEMWKCPNCGREFAKFEQHHFCTEPPKTIEDYIAQQAGDVQPRLREVHAAIKAVLPDALEKISWQMPTFYVSVDGRNRNIIQFAAFKKHIGLFPGGEATAFFAERLTDFKTSKGGVQLPHTKPLPLNLIAEIALWCRVNNVR